MPDKEIRCAFGIDVDAVAGWLGSYGGEDSPDDISRGLFAGEVGVPRILNLLDRLGIKATWFIPGHSIQTFPEQMKGIVDAGHEIGVHGYSHENPIAMTPEQEETVLDYCIDLITELSGRRPTGYVAPWWEFSPVPSLPYRSSTTFAITCRTFVPLSASLCICAKSSRARSATLWSPNRPRAYS